MAKHKPTKQEVKKSDSAETAKFYRILIIATVVLLVLMYVLFFRGA